MNNLRIGTENLHWPNGPAQYAHDVHKAGPQADVFCYQEAYRVRFQAYLGNGFNVFQRANGAGNTDNAMAWRKSRVNVLQTGMHQIGHMESGSHKTFKCAWILARIDGKYSVVIGSVHFPHGVYRREDPGIYEECTGNLASWIRSRSNPVIIGGDWNSQVGSNPGNLAGKIPGGHWVGGGDRGIDGFLCTGEIEMHGAGEISNKALASDHPVVFGSLNVKSNSGQNENPDPPGGTPDPGDPGQKVKTDVRFVTSNILGTMAPAKAKEDMKWVTDNFNPDIWVVQESRRFKDELQAVDGMTMVDSGLSTNKLMGAAEHAVLFKSSKWRLAGRDSYKLADTSFGGDGSAYMLMAHLMPKDGYEGPEVHAFSMHAFPAVEHGGNVQPGAKSIADRTYFKNAAEKISEFTGKDSIILWGGDLNVDRDIDDGTNEHFPKFWFKQKGLVSIWDELGIKQTPGTRGGRLIDWVGGYKNDDHVKATKVRIGTSAVNSDHAFVLGTYQTSGWLDSGAGDPGTPTEPGEEDPHPPHQPFEPDLGHDPDIDHSQCCGGVWTP